MPTKKYLVETDQGKFMVEVDEPSAPANRQAVGGDTINGRDPNAQPGIAERFVKGSLESMAHPTSGLDLIGLAGLSSAPIAESLGPKVAAPVLDVVGRGMSAVGNRFKRLGDIAGIGDVLFHRGGLAEGAAIAGTPYAVDLAGQGLQKTAQFLRRETPLLQFEAPAVKVSRPSASVVEAAKEAAPAVKEVVASSAKSVKPILNALEMKEYMRLTRAGKSHADAMELIDAQREMAKRLNLPSSEKVRQAVQSRNETGRWED